MIQDAERGQLDEFFLAQANWFGRGINGCYLGLSDRTVVEISYLHNEGSTDHYCYYLIGSVKARALGLLWRVAERLSSLDHLIPRGVGAVGKRDPRPDESRGGPVVRAPGAPSP